MKLLKDKIHLKIEINYLTNSSDIRAINKLTNNV